MALASSIASSGCPAHLSHDPSFSQLYLPTVFFFIASSSSSSQNLTADESAPHLFVTRSRSRRAHPHPQQKLSQLESIWVWNAVTQWERPDASGGLEIENMFRRQWRITD
jgi:hypothetical protein